MERAADPQLERDLDGAPAEASATGSGQQLLGAAPGTTLIADSTSVCFYKLAAAALAARPGRSTIITDTDNFPTDRYILEGLAAQTGC